MNDELNLPSSQDVSSEKNPLNYPIGTSQYDFYILSSAYKLKSSPNRVKASKKPNSCVSQNSTHGGRGCMTPLFLRAAASPSAFGGMVSHPLWAFNGSLTRSPALSACSFSALDRFTTGGFTSNYKPTVGLDFSQTNVMVGEQRLRVALWQVLLYRF